jgi:hypothetical protein
VVIILVQVANVLSLRLATSSHEFHSVTTFIFVALATIQFQDPRHARLVRIPLPWALRVVHRYQLCSQLRSQRILQDSRLQGPPVVLLLSQRTPLGNPLRNPVGNPVLILPASQRPHRPHFAGPARILKEACVHWRR